eukprot:SAG11_NODE_2390_length_3412_cov_7.894959_3_plen_130_part_00
MIRDRVKQLQAPGSARATWAIVPFSWQDPRGRSCVAMRLLAISLIGMIHLHPVSSQGSGEQEGEAPAAGRPDTTSETVAEVVDAIAPHVVELASDESLTVYRLVLEVQPHAQVLDWEPPDPATVFPISS